MVKRIEVLNYIATKYQIDPDYPWNRYENYAVCRHKSNNKWFVLIMDKYPYFPLHILTNVTWIQFVLYDETHVLLNVQIIDMPNFHDMCHLVSKVLVSELFLISEIVLKQVPWKQDDTCHENSAYQLFVHSVTHEFHHKGQIVSMLRLLGYEVESTDIYP